MVLHGVMMVMLIVKAVADSTGFGVHSARQLGLVPRESNS